jgi:NAD(P)-dependent dehydrogenase (short-subunit alcohol dehydrogenase family)
MAKTIIITGTSTGIGYGAAKAFTAAGYRVIATVRNMQDAERLRRELGENLHPVLCDVTHAEDVAALPGHVHRISENGWLDGLVNNAGIEIIGPAEFQRMEDIRALFETNVFGLISVTKALLPLLGTDAKAQGHTGRIINISSIGGVMALPFLSSYAATKFAVEGYSHSLRRELRLFDIKVIILGPGAVHSEMWEKDRRDGNLHKGSVYETAFAKFGAMNESAERGAATADSAGEFIRTIFEAPRPKVRYVFTPGQFQNWTLPSRLPHAWLDALFSRMMALRKSRTLSTRSERQISGEPR